VKEPYIKPEIKTEKLKPEALANPGSPAGGGDGTFPPPTTKKWPKPD
jgi:hypothetical protein